MTNERDIDRAVETNRQALMFARAGFVVATIAIVMNIVLGNLPMVLLGVGTMIILTAAMIIIRRNDRNAAQLRRQD